MDHSLCRAFLYDVLAAADRSETELGKISISQKSKIEFLVEEEGLFGVTVTACCKWDARAKYIDGVMNKLYPRKEDHVAEINESKKRDMF